MSEHTLPCMFATLAVRPLHIHMRGQSLTEQRIPVVAEAVVIHSSKYRS